jgi:hypothetical protein
MLIKRNSKIIVAEKDVTVYKMMKLLSDYKGIDIIPNYYKALLFPFIYEVGKLYKTEIGISFDVGSIFTTYEAKHYVGERRVDAAALEDFNLMFVNAGFHSTTDIDVFNPLLKVRNWANIVVTAIIPKGSVYYENELGSVVSNQIIITSKIIKRGLICV